VARFGDRCKLCLVRCYPLSPETSPGTHLLTSPAQALKSGASLSNGMLPEDDEWYNPPPKRDEPRARSRRDDNLGRPMRVESIMKN